MKFGPIPVEEAQGAILAHAVRLGSVSLSKGKVINTADIAALGEAEISHIVVARLEPGDAGEDEAAARIAGAIKGAGFSARAASTGRVNLHADVAGVFTIDAKLANQLNGIDPALTFACLQNYSPVTRGQMIATVKIIPFAVAGALVEEAEAICRSGSMMTIYNYRAVKAGLIQTMLPGTKTTVLDKTERVTAARLERSGSDIVLAGRCVHETEQLQKAIEETATNCDLLIIFGASATSDAGDVIPSAILAAGGRVIRVGMPVDPGNLITIGEVDGKPVIGAPGCARSPKENGFDWVLDRTLAGIDVTSLDIETMGVGGLLAEIPLRPRPRDKTKGKNALKTHAVLLAAGRSSRMGGPNKLLATFDGVPLIRRVATAIVDAGLPLTVVTGHQREHVGEALGDLEVNLVHNPDFGDGLSGSLKTGIRSLPGDADGAIMVLADMPGISASDIIALKDKFAETSGLSIVRATHGGKRGNPVILPKSVFTLVDQIEGDTGARAIVESGSVPVIDVEIGSAASVDVDTPGSLKAAGGMIEPTGE